MNTLACNVNEIVIKMAALKIRGVNFSMDDFGTGYSSLQYLKLLPLDQLKIDQSFVHDIVIDESDRAIVRTIIAMAHSLNLNIIAEGVETEAQLSLLEQLGCLAYQGYFFSKPVPIEQFEEVLKECTKSKKPIKQEPMRAAAEAQLAREYAPTLEPQVLLKQS